MHILPLLALWQLASPTTPHSSLRPDSLARTSVELDSSYRELVVTIGPLHVAQSMAMDEHDPMMMAMMSDSCVGMFAWPRDGWFHRLGLELVDRNGAAIPRRILHHLTIYNLDRRQLVYPIVERVTGFGRETENVEVPASIGMPMLRGQRIAIVVMWDNDSGHDMDGLRLKLHFRLNPRRQYPPPISVLPLLVDANLVAGGINAFDVPPGGLTKSFEFTLPVTGRLLAAGGHLHDHGQWVRLEEADTHREIVTVRAITDSTGRLVRMSRALLALWGQGPRLVAGRRYRLLVRYENPTNKTMAGMMGLLGGLFAPDDLSLLPAIDRSNPDYLADLHDIRGAILDITPEATMSPGGRGTP